MIMSEWNGEGLPPVGTVCEACSLLGTVNAKAIILSDDHFAYYAKGVWRILGTRYAKFRPLQSEQQRQVAELEAMIASYSGPSNKALAQEIYNAGFRRVEQ